MLDSVLSPDLWSSGPLSRSHHCSQSTDGDRRVGSGMTHHVWDCICRALWTSSSISISTSPPAPPLPTSVLTHFCVLTASTYLTHIFISFSLCFLNCFPPFLPALVPVPRTLPGLSQGHTLHGSAAPANFPGSWKSLWKNRQFPWIRNLDRVSCGLYAKIINKVSVGCLVTKYSGGAPVALGKMSALLD